MGQVSRERLRRHGHDVHPHPSPTAAYRQLSQLFRSGGCAAWSGTAATAERSASARRIHVAASSAAHGTGRSAVLSQPRSQQDGRGPGQLLAFFALCTQEKGGNFAIEDFFSLWLSEIIAL